MMLNSDIDSGTVLNVYLLKRKDVTMVKCPLTERQTPLSKSPVATCLLHWKGEQQQADAAPTHTAVNTQSD